MADNCFCHFGGYEVKDAYARKCIKVTALKNTRRLYVDGINGYDGNDGLTAATAFKTMDKFFSLANEGGTDIRCYIVSPGQYDVTYSVFSHVTLHITGNVDGVVLNFIGAQPSERVWYNSHINFRNITLKSDDQELRFESGVANFEGVTFECERVTFYQCHLECATGITVPKMIMYGCTGRLKELVSTHEGTGAICIERGSNIRFYGNLTFQTRTDENTDSAIYCMNSVVYMTAYASGSGWGNFIESTASVVHMTQTVYTKSAAVASQVIKDSESLPSLFIKNHMVIGGDYT